jgi:DNA-directed RNA polymerase subunit RPC12/RpoP
VRDFAYSCCECGADVLTTSQQIARLLLCNRCAYRRECWYEYTCVSCQKTVHTREKSLARLRQCANCRTSERPIESSELPLIRIGYWFRCRGCGGRSWGSLDGAHYYEELRERVLRGLCDACGRERSSPTHVMTSADLPPAFGPIVDWREDTR